MKIFIASVLTTMGGILVNAGIGTTGWRTYAVVVGVNLVTLGSALLFEAMKADRK